MTDKRIRIAWHLTLLAAILCSVFSCASPTAEQKVQVIVESMTLEQKAPGVGRVEVRDTDSPLVFRLTSKDARSLSIRTRLRGQQIRLTYPGSATIDNLDDARRWAHEVAAQCKQGVDPREEQRRSAP